MRRGALQLQHQNVLQECDQLRHDCDRQKADLLRVQNEYLGRVLQQDLTRLGIEPRSPVDGHRLRLCLHRAALENSAQRRVTAWDAEKRALAEQTDSLTRERDALQADAQSHLVRNLTVAFGWCRLHCAEPIASSCTGPP